MYFQSPSPFTQHLPCLYSTDLVVACCVVSSHSHDMLNQPSTYLFHLSYSVGLVASICDLVPQVTLRQSDVDREKNEKKIACGHREEKKLFIFPQGTSNNS